jgi:hypothetical protein
MIVIRKEQMRVFDEQARRAFVGEIARDLREHHPQDVAGLDDAELRTRVAEGLELASRYGMKKKYSLALFIELLFMAAPNFDEYPPIRYILNHPAIPPDDRLDHIIRTLRDSEWDEVRKRGGR